MGSACCRKNYNITDLCLQFETENSELPSKKPIFRTTDLVRGFNTWKQIGQQNPPSTNLHKLTLNMSILHKVPCSSLYTHPLQTSAQACHRMTPDVTDRKKQKHTNHKQNIPTIYTAGNGADPQGQVYPKCKAWPELCSGTRSRGSKLWANSSSGLMGTWDGISLPPSGFVFI